MYDHASAGQNEQQVEDETYPEDCRRPRRIAGRRHERDHRGESRRKWECGVAGESPSVCGVAGNMGASRSGQGTRCLDGETEALRWENEVLR